MSHTDRVTVTEAELLVASRAGEAVAFERLVGQLPFAWYQGDPEGHRSAQARWRRRAGPP